MGKLKIRNYQKKVWLKMAPSIYKISPILASKLVYLVAMKKKLNLKNPKTFNEKIQWLKLYWQNPIVAKCGDKYDVREYIKECGIEEILNPLYGVYRDVKEIKFDQLPKKFAIKGTHGCGYNLICKDKNELDIKKTKQILTRWLNSRYSYTAAEIQYDKMEPKIIVEKFIEGKNGGAPTDYKIFCFNGKASLIMVCEERCGSERAKYYFYNKKWEILPYNQDSKNAIESKINIYDNKPKSVEQMIKYSEILSKDIPFVRVDFYDVNGMAIFGEMTFTPCGGIDSRLDYDVDVKLGKLIELPMEKILG